MPDFDPQNLQHLQLSAQWDAGILKLLDGYLPTGGDIDDQGSGTMNRQALSLGNRTEWLKAQLVALQQTITDLTNGAPGAMDTLNELAAALGDDPNFAATVLAELGNLKTPVVAAVADDTVLDAINTTSVVTAAQGALNPPLAIGGTIEHTELSDGSAMQKAYRITPAGVFLTKHIRTRRAGIWSTWTADGPDIGDLVIQSHDAALLDRFEANGANLSRTAYADLFDRIGTTFGVGDGANTFGTLDARGEFLRGWDNGRGIDLGRVFGSAQLDAFQGHSFEVRTNTNSETGAISEEAGGSGTASIANGKNSEITNKFLVADTPISDGVNGAPRIAAETRSRNIAMLFCIKF